MAALVTLCFGVAPAGAQASTMVGAKKLTSAAGACKGQQLTAKRKRACRVAVARRRKAALARRRKAAQRKRALRGTGAATSSPAPQVIPRPSSPQALPLSDSAPPTPPTDPEPPTDPDPPTDDGRDCELVRGDCDIYSELFWEMRARYERFEAPWLGIGVYPYPPNCMEAAERAAEQGGEAVGCVTAIAFLYPDGTVGLGHWVIDPESPAGWSQCIFDSEGNGPAACR